MDKSTTNRGGEYMCLYKKLTHKHKYCLKEDFLFGVGTSTRYYIECECGKLIWLEANKLTCKLADLNTERFK